MIHTIEPVVRSWAVNNPETVAYLTSLVKGKIQAALASSTVSSWVAEAYGRALPRPADDIDILVTNPHFEQAARILPKGSIQTNKKVQVIDGNGSPLTMIADEALGQAERAIQLVRPRTPLWHGPHGYRTAFSPLAATGIKVVETNQGLVPVAHPFETMALYGLLQRNGDKHDARHVATMLSVCNLGSNYAQARAIEMGWNGRTWNFVRQAGRLSLQTTLTAAAV